MELINPQALIGALAFTCALQIQAFGAINIP